MNKEQIQDNLGKVYDKFTVQILSNSILEYQELFEEKYYKTDKVIDIIIENIPKGIVIYDDSGEKFDAICSLSSKEFKVGKSVISRKDYLNYVFFHEFLHAISFRKHNNMRFMGFYTMEKGDDYKFKSEAFNEAFTEFLTLKRNKMCYYEPDKKHLSGYDAGASQLELLIKIIPEQELVDCYFNCPNQLEKIFQKYKMNMDEIFYSFYALEGMEYEIKALENRYALDNPQDLFKIIDGERYFCYNLLDSFGKIESKEKFNDKWSVLLSEMDGRYNFYKIDGIFRYGELCKDIDELKIRKDYFINNKVSEEKLKKYRLLSSIFDNGDQMYILKKLYEIYCEDYNKYWDLLEDDFAILAYTFLDNIKNSYQLYDIEMYPRAFPYLKKENASIKDVNFEKISCEEENIKFYIFNINNITYVESNYDDITIHKMKNNEFEVKYGNETGILNLESNLYEINNVKYRVEKIY